MAKAVVNAEIRGDASKFNAAVSKAGASVNQFVNKRLSSVAGSIATAFTVGAIVNFTKSCINMGSALTDVSARLGIGIEELQGLQEASTRAGVSNDILERALRNVKGRVQEAVDGNKKYTDSLKRLNISANEFVKLPLERRLEELGKQYDAASDKSAAFRDIQNILGEKAGPQLMEVLQRLSRDGFNEVMESAQKAGLVMSDEVAPEMDLLADKMELLNKKMRVTWSEAFGKTVIGLEALGKAAKGLIIDGKGWEESWSDAAATTFKQNQDLRLLTKEELAARRAAQQLAEANETLAESQSKSTQKTNESRAEINELLKEIDSLNDQLDEAKQTEVTFNIQHMTRQDLKNWNEFFANFQGEDTDYRVDVQLQHITQQQLTMWEKFLNMVRYGNTQTEIKVDLPNLTNHKLKLYEKFFDMVSGAKSYEIKIAKLDPQQLKYYRELVQTMAGAAAFEIKLPDKWPNGVPIDLTGIGALPLSDIAESLRTIAAFKGVICA